MYQSLLLLIPALICYWFYKRTKKTVDIENKAIFITGCDSGIGLALALHAHKLGFYVIATCLNLESEGGQKLRENGSRIRTVYVDVTKPETVRNARDFVYSILEEENLTLWAVINNAGILIFGHFEWQTEAQVMSQMNVNFIGACRVVKLFLPLLRRSKGRIINVTSANGQWPLPGLSIYAASKHALEGFSHSLRTELLPWDVKVILFNPGDLPQSTRLLSMQCQHAEEMKKNFTEEQMSCYGDYFGCFQSYLVHSFQSSVPGILENQGLLENIRQALLHVEPKYFYNNLPLGFRFFLLVYKLVPAGTADKILLRLVGRAIGWDWNTRQPLDT